MRRSWLFVMLLLALLAVPLAAGAQETITLEPVTLDLFGVQGAVPSGWTNVAPGLFARASSANDPVLIALQSAAIRAEGLLNSLLPQLRLTEPPEPVGTVATDALTWTLYQVDVEAPPLGLLRVDLAIAEQAGMSYILLLQSSPNEYDALHEQVFLPALDAYAPLEAATQPTTDVPYTEEAVTFPGGADGVTLAGTLTLPSGDGPYPAVVLVSGSGPQDRDEAIAGTTMKPFALLSDALARAGIAVLRYDDRGVGESTGDFVSALTEDFTADAAAAIAFLEARADINPDQVGAIGHSEGGLVAAQLGAQNAADFLISLAGPAVPGTDLLLQQNLRLMQAEDMPQSEIDAQIGLLEGLFPLLLDGSTADIEAYMRDTAAQAYTELDAETQARYGSVEEFTNSISEMMMAQFNSPWLVNFLRINPADDWAQTTVPVLGLFGTLDVQVDAEQNAGPMQTALEAAGNEDVTIVTLDGANHLFQAAQTGAVSEYGTLPAEFTPDLIPTIVDWLTTHLSAGA